MLTEGETRQKGGFNEGARNAERTGDVNAARTDTSQKNGAKGKCGGDGSEGAAKYLRRQREDDERLDERLIRYFEE